MYVYPAERTRNSYRQKTQTANELVIVTTTKIFHFNFGRENQEIQLQLTRTIDLPTENPSNVYSCEIADKVIFISNLPQSYADISVDRKFHIYDANVKISQSDNAEQIAQKSLTTHIIELEPDETD